MSALHSSTRHIHMDFHTSPHIQDLGADLDVRQFARNWKEAFATGVTIFAKCHHGMCYYPSMYGVQHPGLKGRDLLGELVEALHSEGIRCPIYLTVGWEETAASQHPDWRQLSREGHSLRVEPMGHDGRVLPGGWYWMNWLHPEYLAMIGAQTGEILERYDVDGLFYDILGFDPRAGWSPHSFRFRRERNLTDTDVATFDRFRVEAQNFFTSRMTRFIRGRNAECTIFYNTSLQLRTDSRFGIRDRAAQQTHFEIESLPTAHWGYQHFQRTARYVSQLGLPWLGMTGRFQKGWGDFGGVKPRPALEYECFRAQALGGGVAIGDQLHPRGLLDCEVMDLIRSVFSDIKSAEPFYEGSQPWPQVGILLAGDPMVDQADAIKSEAGAVLLCESGRRDCILIDDASSLEGLAAVILPDHTVVTSQLRQQLEEYYRKGGVIIGSFRAGNGREGTNQLDFLPFEVCGQVDYDTTYWRLREDEKPGRPGSERVIYNRGMILSPGEDTKILVDRVPPYFPRTDATFSSHYQTPPDNTASLSPAVITGKRFAFFADPVFKEFREVHNQVILVVWQRLLNLLLGPPPFGEGLPPSIQIVPRRKKRNLLITVLRYIPGTKAVLIDLVDEQLPLDNILLSFSRNVKEVIVYPSGNPLRQSGTNGFLLEGQGRLLLEVPDYFPGEPD